MSYTIHSTTKTNRNRSARGPYLEGGGQTQGAQRRWSQDLANTQAEGRTSKSRWVRSEWPLLGGRRLLVESSSVFESDRFLDCYRPGEAREIYVGACSGLSRLAGRLNLALYKIGDCSEGRQPERMKELSGVEYGGLCFREGQPINEAGFDDYFPSFVRSTLELSPFSPVRVGSRGIIVRLPDTMTGKQFSLALEEALASASLYNWIRQPEGLRLCNMLNVDPAIAERYTADEWGARTLTMRATEFYPSRSYHDGNRLVAVAERIVLDHMSLLD